VKDLLSDCVHCGFCLPTCPTYQLWGQEPDSPRGRINLMEQGVFDGTAALHFDRCLGCMACVTACPSGVRYDLLIEQTRERVEASHRRPLRERLLRSGIFSLFPYPRRLSLIRPFLLLYQASRLPQPEKLALLPRLSRRERLPERLAAQGKKRAVVGLLTGCVQGAFFPGVNAATARVLAAEGCEVVIPRGQGCCGALSVHNGRAREGERFATKLAKHFAGVDFLVVNSAGCGSTLKHSPLGPKTRDLAEILVELGPAAVRHALPLTAAYHDACHLSHAQGIRAQPRRLLAGIPSLALKEIRDPEICCGSAGIYNLLQPQAAAELGARKAASVMATGADVLVTANPGCMMQIAAQIRKSGGEIAVAHTAEVLDASLRGVPLPALAHAGLSGLKPARPR
jgi:glycolate oxidase iron-sulfur subunit